MGRAWLIVAAVCMAQASCAVAAGLHAHHNSRGRHGCIRTSAFAGIDLALGAGSASFLLITDKGTDKPASLLVPGVFLASAVGGLITSAVCRRKKTKPVDEIVYPEAPPAPPPKPAPAPGPPLPRNPLSVPEDYDVTPAPKEPAPKSCGFSPTGCPPDQVCVEVDGEGVCKSLSRTDEEP